MKKFAMRVFVVLTSVVVIALQPVLADSDSAELEQVRTRVSTMFDQIDPHNIQPSPIDGWYSIRKGAIIAYVTGDGRYLLQGDLIDLEKQVNLSETERNKARLEMISSVPDDQKIIFTPDEVKYSINVFTDIDCTYCRKLHSQIDDYLAQGIEVKYLLYPRNGPTSPSWAKAERVWCAGDRNEAITLAKLDQPFETSDCDASIVGRNYALGRDVGLTGTPAIVLPDGAMLSGYLPPESLAARLALVEKPALAKN
jgi:thiol:disulfide interchange protein DsbC